MAKKLDPQQVVTFEELLRAIVYEQKAVRRILVRKGPVSNKEVMEEMKAVQQELGTAIKAARREMKGKRGR